MSGGVWVVSGSCLGGVRWVSDGCLGSQVVFGRCVSVVSGGCLGGVWGCLGVSRECLGASGGVWGVLDGVWMVLKTLLPIWALCAPPPPRDLQESRTPGLIGLRESQINIQNYPYLILTSNNFG